MGWRGVGIGAAQHIVVTTGLGHSQAAGVSLASVLKEGEKKRSQLQKQQQRHRVSSSTSPRGPLEAGREDNKPQREQHEGSQEENQIVVNQNNTSSHVSSARSGAGSKKKSPPIELDPKDKPKNIKARREQFLNPI